MTLLSLTSIRLDGGTQSRAELSKPTIYEYAEAIEEGDTLPPPVVFDDGSNCWLADGFHRFHALKRAGKTHAEFEVRKGSKREAILFAVGANSEARGLRRTNADKQHAVSMLLADEEWAKKSNRWIASQCGVHSTMVDKMKKQLPIVGSSEAKSAEPRERTQGQDGKWRKPPAVRESVAEEPASEPRQAAPHLRLVESEPIRGSADPEVRALDEKIVALLRQDLLPSEAAKQLGISASRVHGARRRMMPAATKNPLKGLVAYAVEFADTWEDAIGNDELIGSASPEQAADLIKKLEVLVCNTRSLMRALRRQLGNRGDLEDVDEQILQAEP